jgi:Zn-dependent M28 family amino/carboxypeptidase
MFSRRTLTLALLVASLTGLVFASDKTDKTKVSLAKLFNPNISESRIAGDIYYLTTEECEGRGSTTPGIHKAADYIASRLKQAGLEAAGNDGYFQYFDFAARGSAREGPDSQISFEGTGIEVSKNDFRILGVGNGGSATGELVFAGYGIASTEPAYDDFKDVNIEGKVVVIVRKTPRQNNEQEPNFKGKDSPAGISTKVREATKRKAAAVLFVNDHASAGEVDQLVAFNYGGTRAERGAPPVFHVKRGVIDQVLQKAGAKTLADLEKDIDADFKPASKVFEVKVTVKADLSRDPFKIKNIIATVPGAGDLADELVVVGAHYDHVGRGETGSLAGSREIHFGADDNASGSTCNLEIARRWFELQNGPHAQKNRRRVVFQWYAAEEWGLIGSQYYVDHPLFPLEKTASMLNLDMVGRLGFDQFKVGPNQNVEEIKKRNYPLEVMGTTSAKEFPDLVKRANKDLGVEVTTPASSQFFAASDHYSFWRKNIPVMFFFTGMHPQYHRPTDTFQTINIKGIRQCAELGQNIVEELATMPRPEFVKTASTTGRRTPRPPEKTKVEEKKPAEKTTAEKPTGAAATGRPSIGIRPGPYSDTQDGVLVDAVTEGRAAAKAGIQVGDRIIKINESAVKDINDYTELLRQAKAGDKLAVVVDRKGEKVTLTVIYEGVRTAPMPK